MRADRAPALSPGDRARVERLAAMLLAVGADQDVRVLEALAATLVNGRGQAWPGDDRGLAEAEPCAFQGMAEARQTRLELGRRVARRALRGSLIDPTSGATAFHRIEANPAWSRDLLPVATIGSFLFYKTATSKTAAETRFNEAFPNATREASA